MNPMADTLKPKECQGSKVRTYIGHSTVTRVRSTETALG